MGQVDLFKTGRRCSSRLGRYKQGFCSPQLWCSWRKALYFLPLRTREVILSFFQLIYFHKRLQVHWSYITGLPFTEPTHYNLQAVIQYTSYVVYDYPLLLNAITYYYHSMHFFFLSIGREPTTWPANNCLQIIVCSCVVPSKRVLLQIIFCSCVIRTTVSREKWQIASLSCQEVIET